MHTCALCIIPANSLIITFETVTIKIVSLTLVLWKFMIIIFGILKTLRTVSKLCQNGLNSVAVLIYFISLKFPSLIWIDFQQWAWLHKIQTETVGCKISLIWAFVWKAFLSFLNVSSSYLWKKYKQGTMILLAYFLSFQNLHCSKTDAV